MIPAPKTPPVSTGKPSAVTNGIGHGGDSGSMAKRISESGRGAEPRCTAFPFPPKIRIPRNLCASVPLTDRQRVLIGFMDGDIDRPVVLGALYNGQGEGAAAIGTARWGEGENNNVGYHI